MDSATLAGVISTAITFAALIVSSIQLLYQYYTNVSLNALGARNCNERVMGPWAKFTRRRWRWLELRFEIIFESPVLFVAPAMNSRGPVSGQPIWYMDGSHMSCLDTRTGPLPSAKFGMSPTPAGVRHSINVEATWVALLRSLQVMERDSKSWQEHASGSDMLGLPPTTPRFMDRSLAVAVQAQTLSWDFVPNFKKPFATSTIAHMVEIAALLGIHWTMWDPTADRYRAEGNGFILLGSFIAEQGVVFQLIKHDRSYFGEGRLVPNDDVKKFCFGFVPTLWQPNGVLGMKEGPRDVFLADPILPLLRLGSRQEVVETLMDIGLPIQVAEHFLAEDARVSHLFPVIFDVLGMLGRSLSVRGYCYRMLPNPTIFRYDRRWFRTQRLLLEFGNHFQAMVASAPDPDLTDGDRRIPNALSGITSALDRLHPYLHDASTKDYSHPLLEALRDAVKIVDYYLKDPASGDGNTPPSETLVLEVVRDHVCCLVADLRRRPSRLLDAHPLGRNDGGARERGYVAFLFERCRYAVTHREYELDDDMHIGDLKREGGGGEEGGRWPDARVREVTWCLLVFRMLCWLQLHDFHRDDVMIPRSATFGSRMPVYII